MIVLWCVVAVFAAWRVTSLIARERGPFAVGVRLRQLVGVHHDDGTPARDDSGEVLLNPVTQWARVDALLHEVAHGMTCIWCCSVWVSLAVALALRHLAPDLVYDTVSYVVVALALSAGVIALEKGIG